MSIHRKEVTEHTWYYSCPLRGSLLAGIKELGFGECFHHYATDQSGLLNSSCLYKQYGLCWTSAFLLGIWNHGTWWQKLPTDPTPSKAFCLWMESPVSFSGSNTYIVTVPHCQSWDHGKWLYSEKSLGNCISFLWPWLYTESLEQITESRVVGTLTQGHKHQ